MLSAAPETWPKPAPVHQLLCRGDCRQVGNMVATEQKQPEQQRSVLRRTAGGIFPAAGGESRTTLVMRQLFEGSISAGPPIKR